MITNHRLLRPWEPTRHLRTLKAHHHESSPIIWTQLLICPAKLKGRANHLCYKSPASFAPLRPSIRNPESNMSSSNLKNAVVAFLVPLPSILFYL
ncbi:hypothetical protein V6N12_001808 [Hibiscus sabdariffa]|uniref:Uncharacterized protein n=1 Tax=Hibiscus sabdariffa TaxID=183260 RepID=A0ABR2BRG5_9ROSI